MSGEVDLKKGARSGSSFKSKASDSETKSEAVAAGRPSRAEEKVDSSSSSSKGNIGATSIKISASSATNTTTTTVVSATPSSKSSINASSSSSSQSQTTSNKHVGTPTPTTTTTTTTAPAPTSKAYPPLSAAAATTTTPAPGNSSSAGGDHGAAVNPTNTGKFPSTFHSAPSSNPAVPCERGAAGDGASRSGTSPAFTCPVSSDKNSNSHNNNNNNTSSSSTSNITSSAAFVTGGSSSVVDGSSSSKPLPASNPSFEGKSHQNNQSSQPPSSLAPSQEKGSSSSLSARLSLKNLGRRRSPVRTQFTLPTTTTTTNSSGTTSGTDQIPKDSISASTSSANTSFVAVAGGETSGSCVSNNNPASGQTSRGLLLRGKKDRGASASPPLQRSQSSAAQKPGASSSISLLSSSNANKASSTTVVTNPPPPVPQQQQQQQQQPPPILTKTITHPADPNIPWVPGTSAPISVDRVHSVKITRKILHNWRSACGRTKDRTKDLIRRWKTLPENSADFEQLPPTSPSSSKKKVTGSTSNLATSSPSSKRKVQAVKSDGGGGGGGGSGAVISSTTSKNEPKELLALTSSELSKGNSATSKLSVAAQGQQQQRPTENEMPAVGKGVSSGGDPVNSSSTSGGPSSNPAGNAGTVSRLSVGMTGIGRPSISVHSSSNVVNGRTNTSDSGVMAAAGGPSGGQSKSSTGWTVHVWTTYVQRDDLEQGLETEEPKKPDREHLSDFQKVKLTHFFRHVLDMNHDDVISAEDFVALNQRIRHYIEWSSECIEFHILKEVHSGFLECFLNQPLDECSVMYYCNSERETRQHVNIDEWLDVWGGLLHSARTMESLPLWLQYFPKILFQVINKSGSGTISREELRAFYTMFLGIDFRVVNETLEAIHKAMTDGGRHKITYDLFKLCFANFLLGKYPNGPGQYLFGICSPQTLECSFPIDYSALNTHPDDLEPYDPESDKKSKAMIPSPSMQSSQSRSRSCR